MPLYGNELDRATTPFEAGLGRFVHLDRSSDPPDSREFVGRAALVAARLDRCRASSSASCCGIAASPVTATPSGGRDRRNPSAPSPAAASRPRSGQPSPWPTSRPPTPSAGTMLDVAIRDGVVAAEVVPLPFYRRPR